MATQIQASHGVVSTIKKQASEAGVAVLRQGGNAVDAAVAAGMVLCVISPHNVGFGGYGGTMAFYDAKTRRVKCLDFDSRCPLKYRPELYTDSKNVAHHGYLAAGVPGVIAGFDAALKNFGTKTWADVSPFAAKIAEEGFIADGQLAKDLKAWAAVADPASLEAILPDRTPPKQGELFRLPDLAKLIRSLSADPRRFYTGDPAKIIVRQMQAHGGILTDEDFSQYQALVTEPVQITYRGYELLTPPPPSAGITSLSILKTLEHVDLSTYERWGAPYFELFAGASMLCWQDRARWLGDPKFVNVPMEQMLSDKAGAERFHRVCNGDLTPPKDLPPLPPAGEHTCNVVAIDAEGNCVSLTITHGETFGSRVAIGGLGLFLGHGMSRFDYKAGAPNAPQPGKRMQHNMAPLIVLKDGKQHAVIGMPGGPRIVTVTAQLAISVLDFGATPAEAVNSPRIHVETQEPISVNPQVPWEVAAEMVLMGHNVKGLPAVGGPASVAIFGKNGEITAANSTAPDGVIPA
jgi:gamma-glutamyltranspeptidase/glutathione hydrolase